MLNSTTVLIACRLVAKCCCGKACKQTRGLKMHQRSSRVIHGLNNELCTDPDNQMAENNLDDLVVIVEGTNTTTPENESIPVLKKGISQPKKDSEWFTVIAIVLNPFLLIKE